MVLQYRLLYVMPLLGLMVCPGCLCSRVVEKVQEKAAEKALETVVDDGKGGKAKVDLSKGQIVVTDKDGKTAQFVAGGGAKLPDSWPSDVPVFKNAKVTFVIQTEEGANVTFETNESMDAVFQYYLKTMPAQGWKTTVQTRSEETSMLMFTKEPKRMSSVVVSGRDKEKTTVTVTVAKQS